MNKNHTDPAKPSPDPITEDEKAEKERANAEMRDFGEPVEKSYTEGSEAEAPKDKPAETIVEHPLAPTDTNPNPHGTRDEPFTRVAVKDGDGGADISEPAEEVEVEGLHEHGAHTGDGRILHKGAKMKVSKDAAKELVKAKQAKRV